MLASRGILVANGLLLASGAMLNSKPGFHGLMYLIYIYKQAAIETRFGTAKYLTRFILVALIDQLLYFASRSLGFRVGSFMTYGFLIPLLQLPPIYNVNAGITITNKAFDYLLMFSLCLNDWIGVLVSTISYITITRSFLHKIRFPILGRIFGNSPTSLEVDLHKIKQEDVIMLESMGFTRERVLEGLRANNNNIEQTIAYLLSN